MTTTPEVREIAGLLPDEVREQLEKVLASATFGRSQRSQQFLRYVCDLTLRGEGSRINQYLIGSEVFKRGPDYSTDEDSLVRRQAHLLRQKLDTYYSRVGQQDPIRIELPVGHYVPAFSRQNRQADLAAPVVASAPLVQEGRRPSTLKGPMLTGLGAVGLLAIGWMGGRVTAVRPPHQQLPAAVQGVWGPWLRNPAGPIICLSNPMTAVIKFNPDPLPANLLPGHLPVAAPQQKAFRELFSLPGGGSMSLYPSRVNTKIGESLGAALLAVFFTKSSIPVRVTQSRLVSWEDLRAQDSILLGNNEGNPWLDPLLLKYPFRLGPSPEGRRNILNTSPRQGEAPAYAVSSVEGQKGPTQEYALISMIPGLDSRRRLLLINGLNTQATQTAAELMTDADRLQQLFASLKQAAPNHQGDWYFQVITRTEVRDKVPTTDPEIVAIRVL